ncbi:hypothetical protein CTI12_AA623990 [Artemisia annua]|uniref:Uncharacterized protein n=1 Tax=Artemisia annua TaxID=35608 RepID=A0A2U1KB99_ARTAN|nr:hypothetical protein CTI12_AA623990 [Artemisia annua]
MSKGKRVNLESNVDDWEWSKKVLRDVIFPEIYERYGPNAPPNMQLPTETLEQLRREVYGEGQVQPFKASGSVMNNVEGLSSIWEYYNDEPKHMGFVMKSV